MTLLSSGLAVTFIYCVVYAALLLILILHTYNKSLSFKKNMSKFWKIRGVYATVLVQIFDQASDIGVLLVWYEYSQKEINNDDIDVPHVSMNYLCVLSLASIIIARLISAVVVLLTSEADKCEKYIDAFLCLLELYLIKQVWRVHQKHFNCDNNRLNNRQHSNNTCPSHSSGLMAGIVEHNSNVSNSNHSNNNNNNKISNNNSNNNYNNNNNNDNDKDRPIEQTEEMKTAKWIEATFESIPQIILQSVFLIRTYNTEYDVTLTDGEFIAFSLLWSIFCSAHKFVVVDNRDTLFHRDILKPTWKFSIRCVNGGYGIRFLWRYFDVTSRLCLLVLLWAICGGVFILIFTFVTFLIFCFVSAKKYTRQRPAMDIIETLNKYKNEIIEQGRKYCVENGNVTITVENVSTFLNSLNLKSISDDEKTLVIESMKKLINPDPRNMITINKSPFGLGYFQESTIIGLFFDIPLANFVSKLNYTVRQINLMITQVNENNTDTKCQNGHGYQCPRSKTTGHDDAANESNRNSNDKMQENKQENNNNNRKAEAEDDSHNSISMKLQKLVTENVKAINCAITHFFLFHFIAIFWSLDSLDDRAINHILHRLIENVISLILILFFSLYEFDCDNNLCANYKIRNIYDNKIAFIFISIYVITMSLSPWLFFFIRHYTLNITQKMHRIQHKDTNSSESNTNAWTEIHKFFDKIVQMEREINRSQPQQQAEQKQDQGPLAEHVERHLERQSMTELQLQQVNGSIKNNRLSVDTDIMHMENDVMGNIDAYDNDDTPRLMNNDSHSYSHSNGPAAYNRVVSNESQDSQDSGNEWEEKGKLNRSVTIQVTTPHGSSTNPLKFLSPQRMTKNYSVGASIGVKMHNNKYKNKYNKNSKKHGQDNYKDYSQALSNELDVADLSDETCSIPSDHSDHSEHSEHSGENGYSPIAMGLIRTKSDSAIANKNSSENNGVCDKCDTRKGRGRHAHRDSLGQIVDKCRTPSKSRKSNSNSKDKRRKSSSRNSNQSNNKQKSKT